MSEESSIDKGTGIDTEHMTPGQSIIKAQVTEKDQQLKTAIAEPMFPLQ